MRLAAIHRPVFQVLLLTAIFAVAGYLYFGSWSAIRSLIDGTGYVVGRTQTHFIRNVPGIDHLDVTNHRQEPITILGMTSTCRCVSVAGLPVAIRPNETKRLVMTFTPPGSGHDVKLYFYVDALRDFGHLVLIEE